MEGDGSLVKGSTNILFWIFVWYNWANLLLLTGIILAVSIFKSPSSIIEGEVISKYFLMPLCFLTWPPIKFIPAWANVDKGV